MDDEANKRTCHRFEIPEGKGKYKRKGLLALLSGYSKVYPVVNVSKGGLAIECDDAIDRGSKVMVQLLAPGEEPVELSAEVRWLGAGPGGGRVLGVQFNPFGERMGWNPLDMLEVLRRLETTYGENADEGEQREEQKEESDT